MSVGDYFTILFTIKRQVWTDNKSALEEVGTFYGYKQQASASLVKELGLAYGKSFNLWCPVGTDIQNEDIIVYRGYNYSVRAINKLDYGMNNHLEIIIEKNEV